MGIGPKSHSSKLSPIDQNSPALITTAASTLDDLVRDKFARIRTHDPSADERADC
ncbi:hypothetical protein TorRG33x02_208690 [Trema orientale]|uniref:Uncharacterized protein n=1 Tax=Trema orientale TaxID=63057 RepID=A0A2P5ECM8_TREOI|nr:hypothetical protein TorRG33x02_208690 [Trema orientale]